MVMAESVSFILRARASRPPLSAYPISLSPNERAGRPAFPAKAVQSKSLRPMMQSMHHIDQRPCGGDFAFWPHLLALTAFLGRAQAGCDDRRARTRKPSSDANDIGCRGGTPSSRRDRFPVLLSDP